MTVLESDQAASFLEMKRGHEFRSKLSEITNNLKIHEKISLIFLLCKSSREGLEMMDLILKCKDMKGNNLFYMWLRDTLSVFNANWKETLAESLTIIQNYKLAKLLGFEKVYLIEKFSPHNLLKSCKVSLVRKVLFYLCDSLMQNECKLLINSIKDNQAEWSPYLEYKLLTWSEQSWINLEFEKTISLDNLIQCMEKLGWYDFSHAIKIAVEKANCSLIRSKNLLEIEPESTEYYQIIDETNLGLCVIINETNFTSSILPKRWGTNKDVDRLSEVLTAFSFNIRVHMDLSYEQLINVLGYYARIVDKNSSFFILIILSHGSENIIYTSDSLPVDINTIEMIFQGEVCPNLIGKPKIFIVQSCQGEKWQRLVREPNPNIETDNFESSIKPPAPVGPQKGDSLIAWSTVQGFASFRDKYNGSWYVKELCSELWKFGDTLDLIEIFTRVNNNLRTKTYKDQFMVPSLLSSLRAKVRFPRLKKNFSMGRQLMIERLIFDKYFKEFLTSRGPFMLKFELK